MTAEEIDTIDFLNSLNEHELIMLYEVFMRHQREIQQSEYKISIGLITLKHPSKNVSTIINWLDIGAWISVNRPKTIERFQSLKAFL
jgi:hypothetical protein